MALVCIYSDLQGSLAECCIVIKKKNLREEIKTPLDEFLILLDFRYMIARFR
jgi:hypothetical protein